MKTFTTAVVLSVMCVSPVFAAEAAAQPDGGLSVDRCITILSGLNALNCVGQQIGGQCPAGAGQYKLGTARYTIALDIAALGPVFDAARKAQQQFMAELPAAPKSASGQPDDTNQTTRLQANWNGILAGRCTAELSHLKLSDLHLGDKADENAIPPAVLGAISPIVDK